MRARLNWPTFSRKYTTNEKLKQLIQLSSSIALLETNRYMREIGSAFRLSSHNLCIHERKSLASMHGYLVTVWTKLEDLHIAGVPAPSSSRYFISNDSKKGADALPHAKKVKVRLAAPRRGSDLNFSVLLSRISSLKSEIRPATASAVAHANNPLNWQADRTCCWTWYPG